MMTSDENSIIGWETSKGLKLLSAGHITINVVNVPRGDSPSVLLGEYADLMDLDN